MTDDEIEQRIIRQQNDLSLVLAQLCEDVGANIEDQSSGADAILRALSGDKTVRFRAMLFAARRLGAHATRILILSAAENGMSKLRIVVRPRWPSELSDRGARERRFKRKQRTESIGRMVYGSMKDGLDKAAAIKSAKQKLQLNLSNRSIERELEIFRQMVRKRGYVGDPLMRVLGRLAPRLRLSDLPKRGSPKNKPMFVRRLDVFPPPNPR